MAKKKEFSLQTFVTKINCKLKTKITEKQLFDVINRVAYIHEHKSFGYLTKEDIHSQVWVIVMQQLRFFDLTRCKGSSVLNSVERWLNTVVKNRLTNFYRDNYLVMDDPFLMEKINLINILGLDHIDLEGEKNVKITNHQPLDNSIYEELMNFMVSRLTPEIKDIFYDCLSGESVSSYYKSRLATELFPILEEWKEINGE